MIKQRAYDISQTNIANIGSELDHKIKAAAAGKEPAWTKTGKDAGVFVWRIEQFQVKEVAKDMVGKFYDGDAYVVLHSKKDSKGLLTHDVHFWLGDDCSQDEAGTAAYKTVELDDYLEGKAVQYREVQANESQLFLSIFPHFTVLHGGVASGFNHWQAPDFRKRLLHIHGDRKTVFVDEKPVSCASLNSGDVFILDLGLTLIQWNGSHSSGNERIKAGQYAAALDAERMGKAKVEVHAEGDNDLDQFFKELGGQTPIAPPLKNEKVAREKSIWKLSDSTGTLSFSLVSKGALSKSALKTEDVFVVDTGLNVFTWVGAKSDPSERRAAMHYATQYLKVNALPIETSVVRIPEGGHSPEFDSAF